MDNKKIIAKGVRVNNLKNIDIELPLNRFIVMTGVSGSGKSSLAFDTLYAEGQRRYVESLSAYARQFLGRMAKPECDYIKGLPPAIAIEQKVNTRNPRSTVGTATEIYDYLRMLYARVGHTYSPVSGAEVKRHGIDEIVNEALALPEGTRIAVLAPFHTADNRDAATQLEIYLKEGYSRLEYKGEFFDINDILTGECSPSPEDISVSPDDFRLLIDRTVAKNDKDTVGRLTDSIETAYFEGHGACIVQIHDREKGIIEQHFSNRFEADGMEFREPSDLMFNFNNPIGACPECEGFGNVLGISEKLVVPDRHLSIYQNAVQCWRGEKMKEWQNELIRLASRHDFPIHTPYNQLTEKQLDFLWHGGGKWKGIDGFFAWVQENQYKIQYRVMLARYRGKTLCPACHGSRLRADAAYVKVGGKNITELVKMPISRLDEFFSGLILSDHDAKIAERLLTEIRSRLSFMNRVGLGYLTLDRLSSSLSGGESQRINLATSLGSSLVGSLYILDEPSIGLHSRDTARLISVLRQLQRIGNTVVVVEHDEDIMRAADEIVDIGPDAGRLGGTIVYQGSIDNAAASNATDSKSYTLDYLTGRRHIPYSPLRRPWSKYIEIKGASENNLKNIDVKFPLGVMTVVTGVSGSGKSTLVRDILYKALMRDVFNEGMTPGEYSEFHVPQNAIHSVEFVDQNPIGTSSRSNAATYLKAFNEIRKLFSETQLARQMGYTSGYFSFNSEGGRCEECKGEGTITIPMQFMADITVPCEVCQGKRFKKEILEVEYNGKNINDILEMTVDQCIDFLSRTPGQTEKKAIERLQPLRDVGLGYIQLGQSSSSLSGGENQRLKLASFLVQEDIPPSVFIFDEPTTGLHFHDINTLMTSLNRLIDKGHTVIIIEHNMDVIKTADWVIDMGPEGGDEGGYIVCEGTPETIAACPESYTGHFLLPKLMEQSSSNNMRK